MAKNTNTWVVVAIVLVGAYLLVPGFQDWTNGIFAGKQAPAVPSTTATGVCELTPQVSLTAKDKYSIGTIVSPTYKVRLNGNTYSSATSPFTSVYGVSWDVLGNSTASYYDVAKAGTGKCQALDPVEIQMVPKGDLTATFYNDDAQANTAQAIGVDEVKTVEIKLSAANKACFGNPQASEINSAAKMIVVFDYNTTQLDKVQLAGAQVAPMPRVYVGVGEEAYVMPTSSLCDLSDLRVKVLVDAAKTVNPTSNVLAYIMDPELFENTDTGALSVGVEDNDGNAVGQADKQVTILLS